MDPRHDASSFLSTHAPFAAVDATTRKRLAARCQLLSRTSGETLFVEGDPCRHLYILIAGRVKCVRANVEGREQILRVFDRLGDIFCATSAFSTGSHIVTVQAMTDTRLFVIDVDTIKSVALDHPALALALMTTTGEQMRSLVALADDLSLKTATARVAKLLWERARAEGAQKAVRLRRADLREEEIAALVGTVRVHVSRSLKALATMGAITLDRDSIRVNDITALEAFLHAVAPER
jgi:CRP-like cAMP-binding protein